MYHNPGFKKGALLVSISLLALGACKRDKAGNGLTDADDNGGYASDAAKLEQTSNDVVSISDAAAKAGSGSANLRTTQTTQLGCAVVTIDSISVPHVMTIDFGTGCTGLDGKNRSGEIIVKYTGHYKDDNSAHTITYNNYFVNGNQLTGYKTVTNMGLNSTNQVYYTIDVHDTLNLGSGNGIIVQTGSRTRTWLQGYDTDERSDDVYAITGTTTLTRANGNTFTMVISTPLQIAFSCNWIESGVVSITGPHGTRTLDYGNGDCDSQAELTIGTHTYNITLH